MLLDEFLNKAKKNEFYLDIFRDKVVRDDTSIFGKVIYVGDDIIGIHEYTEDGNFDGTVFIYKADISRVKRGGNAQNAICSLIKENNKLQYGTIDIEYETFPEIVLNYYKDKIITFYTESINDNIIFIGKYLDHDENFIKIKCYGNMSSLDYYELLIRIEDITRIDIGTIYSEKLEKIFQNYYQHVIK